MEEMQMNSIYTDLYQHSEYSEEFNISSHQYLLDCSEPALIHAGSHDAAKAMLPLLEAQLGKRKLSYIFISHLGADECGGLGLILEKYPSARIICADHTARELRGFGIRGSIMIVRPGERLSGDDFVYHIVDYPSEAHLMSGILIYEETRRIFFSSDLMMRTGDGSGQVLSSYWRDEVRATNARQVPNNHLLRTLRHDLNSIDPAFVAVGRGFCLRMR